MEKQKITEIKYSYKGTRKERDNTGKLISVEKNFVRYRDVIVVTGWARFGHYMLDLIFYYIFAIITVIPIVLLLIALGVDVSSFKEEGTMYTIIDRLFGLLVLYPGYYILFESTMQSSPGKLILGRIVVNEYGEKCTFSQIVKRSYIRVIPFEAFSCLTDRGWHDNWTDTYVMRKTDLKDLELTKQISVVGEITPDTSNTVQ